jgi:hypothetical protein
MQISQIPTKIYTVWGAGAGASYIRVVPVPSQIGVQDGAASYTDGFPPNCFASPASDGVLPFGQDFNGILNAITAWSRWQAAGALATYDSVFSGEIGGYFQGALLASATPGNLWLSTVDNNTSDPDTGGAGWVPVFTGNGGISPPAGRLTLSSGVPILSSAVTGASSIIYTPYVGTQMPVWNGSVWVPGSCPEISTALSSTAHSPAAAVANTVYDVFVSVSGGSFVLSFVAWTNATTRAIALSRVSGILTNASNITNGPNAGYGVYVSSFMTDPAAATVSFNPQPAAASSGPSGGAWVGLWNYYNRVPVGIIVQDSNGSWTYTSATWRQADASANNKVTFVCGAAEDGIEAAYQVAAGNSGSSYIGVGIGLDSTTVPAVIGIISSGTPFVGTQTVRYVGPFVLGQHYLAALEAGTAATFYGTGAGASAGITGQAMQLSASIRY